METNKPIVRKLAYPGGFPVYAARYVIFPGTPRRLALHFFNGSDVLVTGVRWRLFEKDGEGEPLSERVIDRRSLFAEAGSEFSVPDVTLDAACVDVEVRVEAVFSDGYEYTVNEDGADLEYGEEPEAPKDATFREKVHYSVSRHGTRKYLWLTVLFTVVFLAFAILVGWRMGTFRKYTTTADRNERTFIVRTISEYVEA